MHIETALTLLIADAEKAPYAATGHGAANQRARKVIEGHMVEANVRGGQARIMIDGCSKPLNRDVAYDVLAGATNLDEAEVEYFHGA